MIERARRRTVLAGVGATGAAALAGCSGGIPLVGSSDGGGADRTIELGILLPLSGDLSGPGEAIRDGAVLPARAVESGTDLLVDYAVEDTETSASVGVRAAFDLVERGYPMVTGPASSDVTLRATQEVLIPHRTVCCSPASTSPTISTLNDAGLVFRTAVSDAFQSVVLARQAAADLGHDAAATLYVDDDYGWQLSRAFGRAFESDHGGTVLAQVPFGDPADEGGSYADVVAEAVADDPPLLVVVGFPDTGARLLDAVFAAGGERDVLVTDGLRSADLHETVEAPLDGVRGTAPLAAGPGVDEFADRYESAYGEEPGVFTAEAFDASAVLLLANAYAGRNDGPAIRNAVRTVTSPPGTPVGPENLAAGVELAAAGEAVEYRGASSPVRFDGNGDSTDATYEYFEFDAEADGGVATVEEVTL